MTFSAEECYIYRGWRRNQTDLIVSGYEGVPQNLILNVLLWVIMIVIFSVLRKRAWNYGRIAFVERTETSKWTEFFFGSANFSSADNLRDSTSEDLADGNQNQSSHSNFKVNATPSPQVKVNRRRLELRTMSIDFDNDDKSLFAWIKITLTLSDDQFLQKSGPDAVQYLSYQRHLIFLAAVMTVFSLVIVAPIHLSGKAVRKESPPEFTDFRQATIQNLYSDSKFLWIHIILSISFVFISILCMRHFSKGLKFISTRRVKTLLINGIGTKSTHADVVGHLSEAYPSVVLEEVNYAYDISRLMSIETKIEASQRSILYCRSYLDIAKVRRNGTKKGLKMTPYCCGGICLCFQCICGESADAIEYYSKAVDKYKQKAELERRRVLTKPLPVLFVTFKTVEMAETVMADNRIVNKLLCRTPRSKFSSVLKSSRWNVSYAPLPGDIIWENLSQGTKTWYIKLVLVNSVLLVVTCFYSTPVFLLNALNVYLAVKRENESDDKAGVSGIIRDTIPTVLLWIAAVLIPSLVSVSDRMIGFWTRTAENRSKMIKTFTFLLFMVIILPSLGLTSFIALLGKPVRWDCIFSSTNVAFFVHYITTSCFIGTASELMRFPELFLYMVKLCFTRSEAEIVAVRKASLWEFQLGSQYAWMMLNFAIFTLFSLVCPVITPFGLMYLIMKHFVDRYNIFFAYGPCKVDKVIHSTAINFVIVCMFLLQVILLAFVNSNSSELVNKPLQAFAVVGISLTAALFVGQVFFNMCASFSPILYHQPREMDKPEMKKSSETGSSSPSQTLLSIYTPGDTGESDVVDSSGGSVEIEIEPKFQQSLSPAVRPRKKEICIMNGKYFAPILT